jgi:uncharacterized membrane protein
VTSRLREWLEALGDVFWIRPALLVLGGVVLGQAVVLAEQTGTKLPWVPEGWVYTGGEAGARSLLGAVASSTIGVAGTTFSITVAALSLASGQMGRACCATSCGTAAISMPWASSSDLRLCAGGATHRPVRRGGGVRAAPRRHRRAAAGAALRGDPRLVRASRRHRHQRRDVIDVVHAELSGAIKRLGSVQAAAIPSPVPPRGVPVTLAERGYLRAVDEDGLAGWAAERGAVVVLLVRPGDYLFPGATVAELVQGREGGDAERAIRDAFSVGSRQAAAQDLQFAVRQLVEIALRALSPGINDPFTAIAVLDRLGAALCEIAPRHLPGATVERGGRAVLHRQVTDYAGSAMRCFT